MVKKAGGVKPQPVPRFSKDMTEEQKKARKQIQANNKKFQSLYKSEHTTRKAARIATFDNAVRDKTAAWNKKDAKDAKIAQKNLESWNYLLAQNKMEKAEYDKRVSAADAKAKAAAQRRKKDIEAAGNRDPKPTTMSPAERKQVNDAFKKAANKLQSTQGLPGRKDTYTVGTGQSRSSLSICGMELLIVVY